MIENPLLKRLRDVLAEEAQIRFAVLYGSAADPGSALEGKSGSERRFRDLDVAVWLDEAVAGPRESLAWAARVEITLREAVEYPVDLRILNQTSLPFRYNVSRGVPLLVNDREAWFHFLERTWDEYLDFQPIAKAYLEEMR